MGLSTLFKMIADNVGGAESVTGVGEENVSIDPSLLNKPQMPQANGEDELLKHKLGLANQHAKKAQKEAVELKQQLVSLQEQMESMQAAQQSAVQKNLESQGAFKELYEQEKSRSRTLEERLLNETASLKTELESVTRQASEEKLKTTALGHISRSNALNPSQLYQLLAPQLRRDDEGNPVMLNEGVEQPLGEYLSYLRDSPEWQHHFSASQQAGMGVTSAQAGSISPGRANPYRSKNLTEALALEVANPELAKALKAEARG